MVFNGERRLNLHYLRPLDKHVAEALRIRPTNVCAAAAGARVLLIARWANIAKTHEIDVNWRNAVSEPQEILVNRRNRVTKPQEMLVNRGHLVTESHEILVNRKEPSENRVQTVGKTL